MKPQVGLYKFGRHRNLWAIWQYDMVTELGTSARFVKDVFSYEEVADFVNKITEEYGKNIEFVVETKIDGLSVSLEYENGILVKGSTRGNGLVGEEITKNLLTLDEINEKLNTNYTIEYLFWGE